MANQKVMEPTLHFARKRIVPPASDSGVKVLVSELVGVGDLLVDFPKYEKFKEKGYVASPTHAGSNTQQGEHKLSLVATVAGYPRVDLLKLHGESEPTMIFSVTPLVDVAQDKMSAKFFVHPSVPEANSLQGKDVLLLLADSGVVHGIDTDVVSEAQKFIDDGCADFQEFSIATGDPCGDGQDARLEFHITIGPIAGQILEDGSIDFRERRIMVGVSKGDHIATKFPALPGTPGIDVYGEEVEPEGGVDVIVKTIQDAGYDEASGKVIAVKDGILSVVKNSEIRVCENQIIEGDVDYETGNLESMSCLTVKGDVQPGFKVVAGGDLEIGGGVMSAKVSGGANVVIKGGVTGKKSTVKSAGDTDLRFIEQGSLEAGGNIVIRKQSYYSKLISQADIRFKEGAKIIGESLIAAGSITVSDVGSENSEPALLAAGIDNNRLAEYHKLKKELVAQQDAIIQWLQMYGGTKRSKKIRGMEKEVDDTKLKLLQLNLVPGTGKYSRGGGEDKVIEGSNPEDYSERGSVSIHKITIDVQGKIFAGTTLMIGNRKLVLDKTLSKRQFKLASNLKRIIAAPLGRKRSSR